MSRTTLVLDEALLRQLKKKAAEEGRTFQAVATELLRRGLAAPQQAHFKLQWSQWKSSEMPGVNLLDRDALLDLLDDAAEGAH